jgi:hypothetical protein
MQSQTIQVFTAWQVASFDVFSPREAVTSWKLEVLQSWERLICYGRPGWAALWRAHTNKDNNPYSCEALIRLAQRKLMAGITNYNHVLATGDSNLIQAINLTLLSRRALLHIGKHSKLARTIVASCMGICMEVSYDLESLRVEAPSEPILSEAAARLIGKHELWPQLVRSLLGAIADGAVDSDGIGEITSWILMAMTWDAACISKFTSSSDDVMTFTRSDITLGDFLKALLGEIPVFEIIQGSNSAPEVLQKDRSSVNEDFCNNLLKRRLCFTHAIQLNKKTASFEDLEQAACRMAIIITHKLTPRVDAVAVLYPAKGAEKEELGTMQIEIKNRGSLSSKAFQDFLNNMLVESLFTTRGKTHFAPGLDIVFNIGHKTQGRRYCKFYAQPHSVRACLELSTDANLTLFRNVFEAVTRKTDGADSRVAADSLQSLMARLVDFGRVQLNKDESKLPRYMPGTVEKELQEDIEDIMEVYNLGGNHEA